jgi:hypothetical protein
LINEERVLQDTFCKILPDAVFGSVELSCKPTGIVFVFDDQKSIFVYYVAPLNSPPLLSFRCEAWESDVFDMPCTYTTGDDYQ